MRASRSQAVATTQSLLTYLRDWRPVWTHNLPREEGYYWMRESKSARPEVVEVRVDYSEAETPFVIQSGNPANVGVQYLSDFHGCQWCGPLEKPENE